MTIEAGAMDHEALTNRIPDLMAGNGRRWGRRRLNRHLKSCAPCQAELQRYQAIHEGLEETVPSYLAENRPSDEFMTRVHQTIATHPLPARSKANVPRAAKLTVPAITAVLAVIAIVLVITFSGGNGASALSLATPVKGTMSVTQAGDPVAAGTFAYVSPEDWERSTTYLRFPASFGVISEITANDETYSKTGDGQWQQIDGISADRQPIPGLGDLGLAERLFDAVLSLYELEKDGQREFRGDQLTAFTGVDADHATRIRDSALGSGATDAEATALFDFYSDSPPGITVLADSEERIRAIFIAVSLPDTPEPLLVELVVDEFNAEVEITSPLP